MAITKGPWIVTNDGEANFYGIANNLDWVLRVQQHGGIFMETQKKII